MGTYNITVEAAGFEKFVHSGVTVNASRSTEVDVVLEAGAAALTATASVAMTAVDTA
jgi:hypothetical protein